MTPDERARTEPTHPGRPTVQAPRPLRRALRALERQPIADPVAERLEPVAAQLDRGTGGAVLRGEWLGHALHPLLTDLPIGCWVSASLVDLVGGPSQARAAQRLTGLGLLAVPVTVATGLADWDRASDDDRVRRVGAIHAVANTAVTACYLASWWSRRSGHRGRGVLMGLAGGVLAMGSGYLGGHLSYARAAGVEERGLTPEVA